MLYEDEKLESEVALDDWGMMTGMSGVALGMLEQEEQESEFLAMGMSLR